MSIVECKDCGREMEPPEELPSSPEEAHWLCCRCDTYSDGANYFGRNIPDALREAWFDRKNAA